MPITKNNVETAAEILEIISRRRITVRQFGQISDYITGFLVNRLTVEKMDFRAEMLRKWGLSEEEFEKICEENGE